MLYRVLADLVLVLHALFIAFVVAGALLVLRWPRVAWAHVPCALWGAWIEVAGRICPLTPWENALRRAGGQAGYEGGFIERYLLPIIYPGALTREIQLALATGVIAVNMAVYAWVVVRRRKRAAEVHKSQG